jgi:hypothetical protein
VIVFSALIPLALLAAVIAGIAGLAKRNHDEPPEGFVRRLVVGALTFGMTIVLAVGIYLLVGIVFGSIGGFARSGSSDVASAFAMVIVGGPAAFLLWRYQLQKLAGPDGRSIVWLLHQAIATATFSIGTVVAMGNGLQFHDFDSGTRNSLAFGLAWFGAWLFHEWVGVRRPVPILPGLPRAIGAGVGLITAAGGSVAVVATLFDLVFEDGLVATSGRFDAVINAAIWTVVGLVVWGWQFFSRTDSDRLSRAGLVLTIGVGGGALLGLGGAVALITIALNSITGDFDVTGFGGAVGAVVIGFLLWRYHAALVTDEQGIRITRHIVSGLSLISLAVGIGVLVNGALAMATPRFAARNEYELLWGGLAAILVGAPVWWITWRPDRHPDPDSGTLVQRTYLTLLAGVAGISGAIALIFLVYQLLEGLLDGDTVSGIVDGIRAPLGFVVATGLVTAYHYRRWAAGRRHEEKPEPITLERITFVGSAAVATSLRTDLNVRVAEWRSAGEGRVLAQDELAQHLRSLDATDVLVVEDDRGYRVIRLLRDNGQRPHTGEPQE